VIEPFGIPWVPPERVLDKCHQAVRDVGDAAALVEAVRHCHERGQPVPDWIVGWLECWLAEFLALVTPRKGLQVRRARITAWGREYFGAWCDGWIADHLETTQRKGGLTRKEALDEASCYFRGTRLAGSPHTLEAAWKRARRRAKRGWLQRRNTYFENRQLRRFFDPSPPANSPRCYWAIINADRHPQGEWIERPRRLAHLSPAALEREAHQVMARWREKSGKKTPKSRPHI
jgi:hypothetical protein